MGDLFSVLSQSSVSMDAQQSVSQTISQNIDNANTPGYSEETAVLQTLLPEDLMGTSYLGQGVDVQTVTQSRNQFVESQMPGALGSASSSSVLASTLTSLSALDPTATGGLASQLSNFYGSLEALSQNAGNSGLRQAAVAGAQALALAFNNTSQAIASARSGVDSQLGASMSQINGLAAQVAQLNQQIASARAAGGSPNGLLDARQQAQDQLEQLTGATPVPDGQGNVNLVLSDGQALVSGDLSATLSTQPDPQNGGHLQVLLAPAGEPATALQNAAFGGTVGGLLSARDGALLTAQNQVDQLAFDVGTAVNAVQQAGFTEAGQPGQPLFTLSATPAGAAAQIQVSAAIVADPTLLAGASTAASGAGDGSNFIAMLATQSQALSSGQDVSDSLASLTAQYGAEAQQAQTQAAQDASALGQVQQLRQSSSGVSIDQEMINLDKTQQVYQAIGRVITATDTMLNTLMQIQ